MARRYRNPRDNTTTLLAFAALGVGAWFVLRKSGTFSLPYLSNLIQQPASSTYFYSGTGPSGVPGLGYGNPPGTRAGSGN